MTYQEALKTIRETMDDNGISVAEMAKYFVDHQEELQMSDRDLGIVLAGLDLENGEGLQYLTPEAKDALQSVIDENGEGDGSEEEADTASEGSAPEEGPDAEATPADEGAGDEEPEPDTEVEDEEAPEEDTESDEETGDDEEEPEEDEEGSEDDSEDSEDIDNKESMKKMFYN